MQGSYYGFGGKQPGIPHFRRNFIVQNRQPSIVPCHPPGHCSSSSTGWTNKAACASSHIPGSEGGGGAVSRHHTFPDQRAGAGQSAVITHSRIRGGGTLSHHPACQHQRAGQQAAIIPTRMDLSSHPTSLSPAKPNAPTASRRSRTRLPLPQSLATPLPPPVQDCKATHLGHSCPPSALRTGYPPMYPLCHTVLHPLLPPGHSLPPHIPGPGGTSPPPFHTPGAPGQPRAMSCARQVPRCCQTQCGDSC